MKDSADSIAFSIASMRELETFSASDSRFASIGASVKILASFVFILCVVSFGVYDLRVLLFFVFPAMLWIAVRPPAKIFFNRLLIVLPFVLFTGISNLRFSRQYRTKSVWRLCTPSACKFPVIFHKNAREYIKYSLRFLFHLTKNLTTHLSHNLCAVLP